MGFFVCEVCQTSEERYIGYRNGKPYCRRCITFKGEEVKPIIKRYRKKFRLTLDYSLSPDQMRLSENLILNYMNGIDTLVEAVCGAGKTEIVYNLILTVLNEGGRVGFTIPRRDVVIELFERFKSAFSNANVVAVYGGHHDALEGDLIILTTHQLYRYDNYFDLLIIDEIDAFPFVNNEVLERMFFRAIKSRYVMMSATPNLRIKNMFKEPNKMILSLNTRFHKNPLPVPKVEIYIHFTKIFRLMFLLHKYKKEKKPTFVFVPTIRLCEIIYKIINFFIKGGEHVHSKRENREKIIEDFKANKYDFLITTSVLERGVTIKNLQVIIFDAHHDLYDKHSLVQISGRAGRKADSPKGDVIFLVDKVTPSVKETIDEIKGKNLFL